MFKLKNLGFMLLFIFFINLSFANIVFEDISLINNSILNESNIQIDIILLNNGSSGNYLEIVSPRTNVGNYGDLMLNADDVSAKKYCEQKFQNIMLRYEKLVTGNLYAYFDGAQWQKTNSWTSEKINKIVCNSKSSNLNLYYNLDNSGNTIISTNELVNTIQLENLLVGLHNISFYVTDNASNMTISYFFNITSPSTNCLLPNGNYLNTGENITLYENELVDFKDNCNSEIRVCTNGILSGNFIYNSCINDIPKNKLKFHHISLENNTFFMGRNLTINLSLINENFYIYKQPKHEASIYDELRIYANNETANRFCFEKHNGTTFYSNYTTINNNYLYTIWNGSKWLVEENPKIEPSIDTLYCEGYNNNANLYYSLDGADYILFSSNLSNTNLYLDELYYLHHTIQFFANESEENYVYSDLFKFSNNASIPDDLSNLPGLLNEEKTPSIGETNIITNILNWIENIFT